MKNPLDQIKLLTSVLKKQEEWGIYYMGKFYFTISTRKSRAEVGLSDQERELAPVIQRQLQQENLPAIFHEYIHYLHEVSTVIGNAGLAVDLCTKSAFTHWLDPSNASCESRGFSNDAIGIKYAHALTTSGVLMGEGHEAIDGRFIEVRCITSIKQDVYFPHKEDFQKGKIDTPKIEFTQLINNTICGGKLLFGKYFIYEGLAYELDRIIDMRMRGVAAINDEAKGTEYTVLRRIAQFVFPNVDKQTYLCVASMSLQYIECGNAFIKMLAKIKNESINGKSQFDILNIIKRETIELLNKKRKDFRAAQDEYKKIFYKRKMLRDAFQYLTNNTKSIYDERIKNPTFEVDLIFEGEYEKLLSKATICDYMYLFNDKEDYMRDYLGTSIDGNTSYALKVLLACDHFYRAHQYFDTSKVESNKSCTCPFYTCCDLKLRQANKEICRTRPWRIYEVSFNSDKQYCWYGQGVLESKGVNEK